MKKAIFATLLANIPLLADAATPPSEYEHRFNFGLFNLGYERILTDSVYAGLDTKLTTIWSKDSNYKRLYDYFVNSEFRLGYNFSVDTKDQLIPYAGVGFSMFKIETGNDKIKDWSYATGGLKYLHQFGDIFEIGLHVKACHSIQEKRQVYVTTTKKNIVPQILQPLIREIPPEPKGPIKPEEQTGAIVEALRPASIETTPAREEAAVVFVNVQSTKKELVKVKDTRWLLEASIPMIWHVGSGRNWEIQFEPYYSQIPNGKKMHLFGSRLGFGYRF